MTSYIGILDQPITHEGDDQVTVGNENTISIGHSGKRTFETPTRKLYMQNLFLVPKTSYNILSISCLIVDNNSFILFDAHEYVIKDNKTSKVIIKVLRRGLYKIYTNNKE